MPCPWDLNVQMFWIWYETCARSVSILNLNVVSSNMPISLNQNVLLVLWIYVNECCNIFILLHTKFTKGWSLIIFFLLLHCTFVAPLHPYEELRLRQCMRNSARLQQLGLIPSNPFSGSTTPNSQDKNKTKQRNREDSKSNYEPDSVDDDIAKVRILPSCQGLCCCLFVNAI